MLKRVAGASPRPASLALTTPLLLSWPVPADTGGLIAVIRARLSKDRKPPDEIALVPKFSFPGAGLLALSAWVSFGVPSTVIADSFLSYFRAP